MRWALGLLLLGTALAGCIGGTDDAIEGNVGGEAGLTHLTAAGALETIDENGVRTFVFEDEVPEAQAAVPLFGGGGRFYEETFEADGTVGYVKLLLEFDEDEGDLFGFIVDDEGRTQCAANTIGAPKQCTTPTTPDSSVADWTVELSPGFGNAPAGMAFRLEVSLHPPSHLPVGDPLAGTDPTIAFRVSDTGVNGAEPNIGVLSDGTIFAQMNLATMRSTDDGATWEDVAPVTTSQISFDPMLRVDPYTDTVYVDQLYIGCSILAWSSDGGDTWATNPAACGLPGNDHQKLAVGPNPLPVPFNAVYYAYSSFVEGAWVSRSLDGGLTWTSAPVVDGGYRNTGPVEADRDGTVFVPYYLCDGAIGVGVSNDFGATFSFQEISGDEITCDGTHRTDADPGPAVDSAGNLYIAYRTNEAVRYTYSTDKGATWSEPVTVSPPGLLSFTHVDAVAGDDGRLAIAYRATPDSELGPNADGFAAWHMYVTFVENAASDAPTNVTGIINDPSDPVQRGPICSMGSACSGGSRNLLDFIDIAVGPDGRVYVVYSDGCDGACPTPADSRERMGLVGILEDGPRLFDNGAPWT